MRIGSAFVLSAALALCACGGSSGGGGGGGTCNPGATTAFTIKSTGITPSAACVNQTGSVAFNNTDTAAHTLSSTDCTELNAVGAIQPSASTVVNFNVTQAKTCTFSVTPGSAGFQGTLAVTNAVAQGPGY